MRRRSPLRRSGFVDRGAGSPWRDLLGEFSYWISVFKRFRRWVQSRAFEHIFLLFSEDADLEYLMVDGTTVRLHRHGQEAKGELKIRRLCNGPASALLIRPEISFIATPP